jgi:hypothetical protein
MLIGGISELEMEIAELSKQTRGEIILPWEIGRCR